MKSPSCVLFCCADGSESPAATVPFFMKPEVSQEEKKRKPTRPQAVVINRRRNIAAGAAITGARVRDASTGAAAVGHRRSFSGRIGSSIARRLGLHSRSVSRENQVAPAPSHGHTPTKVSCWHFSWRLLACSLCVRYSLAPPSSSGVAASQLVQVVNFDETLKCLAAGVFKLKVALNHPPPAGSLHAWWVYARSSGLIACSLASLWLVVTAPALALCTGWSGTRPPCCRPRSVAEWLGVLCRTGSGLWVCTSHKVCGGGICSRVMLKGGGGAGPFCPAACFACLATTHHPAILDR